MKIVVTVPTYDEAQNIEALVTKILAQDPRIEVLVADDSSPDGTAELVRKLGALDPRVQLLLRKTDRGRGRAGRDAFVRALARNADLVFEMDADFSHDPSHLPEMIKALERFDVVLGSRQVPGGADIGRPAWRRLLTRLSNQYVRVVLGLPVLDCNSGYRGWRRHALQVIDVGRAFSPGPAIVHELLYKAHLRGQRLGEIPIRFKERERGSSTLSFGTLLRSYLTVLRLRSLALTGKLFERRSAEMAP